MEQVKYIAVVPYRKKLGVKKFLLKKELFEVWDNHLDSCAITISSKTSDYEHKITDTIKTLTGYEINEDEITALGLCMGSRNVHETYYLYTVDLSKHSKDEEEFHTENIFWGSEEDVMDSIDPILLSTYSRLKYFFV